MSEKVRQVVFKAKDPSRQSELEAHLRGDIEEITAYNVAEDGTISEITTYPKPPEFERVIEVAENIGKTIDLTNERVGN